MKLKTYLTRLIDFYQKFLSPRNKCVFFPSCSEYSKEAMNRYGIIRGLWLTLFRILRCHPWQKNHIDPLQ